MLRPVSKAPRPYIVAVRIVPAGDPMFGVI